ncbi:hypothetical protein TVAG_070910 [Trichomonas vaginalis G3]|uniref:Uncharacterized protein n=1 Tax=Trichomonas vaginalis (strain ATCC PRA-98 / G3) TaxID=412133 RepID=A2D7Z4_TRIV3|nr:hypothetical protein TVAGG3_1045560 [Trichomonas vaginalis G3]EAY23427.1 hypothetical protein TVAG_070910 [Trichomonas vaginalis G3]KAI5493840.1 hypothetical protein TVAGG3_1045560 [Trichomonas vaginalis G3]|eukprot:XP_001584413.1 hypothetical protein [Trichomonas vaginalis G3]
MMEEDWVEFYKHLLLKQIEESLLFLKNDPQFMSILAPLLKLPGDDPIKDVKKILFRWTVRCIINRLTDSKERPEVPLDFSASHPALSDPNELSELVMNDPEQILDLVKHFPFEFFKTLKTIHTRASLELCDKISQSEKFPLHLIGRIVSSFPISITPFNFQALFDLRCKTAVNISELYEGLMCNFESHQLESAELLSTAIDPYFEEDAIVLANQSQRYKMHFVDIAGRTCSRVFPTFGIVNFLIQIDKLNTTQMLKQLNKLPDHIITRKVKNQLILAQVLGLGDDWSPVTENSIPKIITPECIADNILPFTRDSEFINISKESWETDFDFIQSYGAIKSFLTDHKLEDFPESIAVDLFSLLFLPKFLKKVEYQDLLDFLTKLQSKLPSDSDLHKYVSIAIKKAQASSLIFKEFKSRLMFYPYDTYFKNCPPQNLVKLMNILELYPSTAYSTIFRKNYFDHVKLPNDDSKQSSIFLTREFPMDLVDDYTIDKAKEVSVTIPAEQRDTAILDLACSHRQLSRCNTLVTNSDLQKYIEKIFVKEKKYPDISDLAFTESPSVLKKKINDLIMQFDGIYSEHLMMFSHYVKQLLTTSSRMLEESPEQFIFSKIKSTKSLQNVLKVFENTGVEVEEYIYQSLSPNDVSKSFLIDLVKNEPLSGLVYSYERLEPRDVAQFFESKTMTKLNARSKHFEIFERNDKSAKKVFETLGDPFDYCGEEDLEPLIPTLLENIKKMDEKEACSVLCDLSLMYDMEKYHLEILEITKKFKNENRIPLYETLLALFPPTSNTNILFYKRFPNKEWQEMLDISYDSDRILESPDKVYNKCLSHLSKYNVETTKINNIMRFSQLLLIIRAKNIFNSREKEKEWILKMNPSCKNLSDFITGLNDDVLMSMIVSIATMTDPHAVLDISKNYKQEDLFAKCKPYALSNSKILDLLNDEMTDEMISSILKDFTINSLESESKMILDLRKLQKMAKENFKSRNFLLSLLGLAENGLFAKYNQSYKSDNLQELCEFANKYDFFDAINSFYEYGIDIDKTNINKMMSLLGVSPSGDGEDTKCLFESPTIKFNLFDDIYQLPNDVSSYPSLMRIDCQQGKLKLFKRKPNHISIKKPKTSDLPFLDISNASNQVKLISNKFELLSFDDTDKYSENIDYQGKDVKEAVTEMISYYPLHKLFDSALNNVDYNFLKELLVIFDSNSCIHCLLILSSWALDRSCSLDFFAGERNLSKQELSDFVTSLKTALTSMTLLSSTVDSSVLLPPGSVLHFDQKSLNDVSVILEYQRQVGRNVQLVSSADKGKACVTLLKNNEYSRAFAMIKALGVDTTDVMIEAAAHFGQLSNTELGNFLVNVVPRLDVESANQLTETLASILVGNKFEDSFIGTIIAGIDQPRNAFKILKWFGLNETAAFVALQNGLREEIEQCKKDIRMKKNAAILRACACWVSKDTHQRSC